MHADTILEGLDPEQREVAQTLGSPLVVLAGAGTGKTRAMTHRIAYAVASGRYNPRNVLAVTFTTKAAAEMASRLRDLGAHGVQARTFHSAALRQLTYFWSHTIGGPAPQLVSQKIGIVANAAAGLHLRVDKAALRDITAEIEWAKVSMILPEQYPVAAARLGREGVAGFDARTIARIMSRYEVIKSDNGAMDFDDVLLLTAQMIEDYPHMARQVRSQYKHFVVDEFQDVSPLQHKLLRAWLGHSQDVCVVGDAAQTIYTFAGANSEYLLKFREHFPRASVIKLERNYRSTPEIVEAANGVLARGRGPHGTGDSHVRLRAQRRSGPRPVVQGYSDDVAEAREVAASIREMMARGTPASDIAILYRTNAQSENFEYALAQAGIAFLVRGGEKFFQRREVREAMGALRAGLGAVTAGHDLVHVTEDILASHGWTPQAPETGGAVRERWDSLNALVNLARTISERPGATLHHLVAELDERADAQSAPPSVDSVTLASIHAAKGLEWPVVFVVGASEGLIPISLAKTDEAIEEERRLFYVALTRARDVLTVTWAAARGEGARASRKASRFIAGAFERHDPPTSVRATPRSTGRRHSTVYTTCRSCAQPLTNPREQKIGRHPECGSERSAAVFGALRRWRLEESQRRHLPAFAVFTDATLLALADRAPRTRAELLRIPGIGESKAEKFGREVLQIIAQSSREHTD